MQNKIFNRVTPHELLRQFDSPLYVYDEVTLRNRCKELKSVFEEPVFGIHYSAKANTNPALLAVIKSEGLTVDAMSAGEILMNIKAGFKPKEILFISNNVSVDEMKFAINKGVNVSVDSLDQLEQYGRINSGGGLFIRFNPGVGDGCHKNLITGGRKTKFGINEVDIESVKLLLNKYNLTLIGINQHIGSNFMDGELYIEAADRLMLIAEYFESIKVIDFGGGFGVSYDKSEDQHRINLQQFGKKLKNKAVEWKERTGWNGIFKVEPGRYVVAECGILLGKVHAVKKSYDNLYYGTDIGFNVLHRPMMYGAYHEVQIFSENSDMQDLIFNKASVVGNICETGDYIAKDRELPEAKSGDVVAVMNTGAYGSVMSSNYNMRLRPAEILINMEGEVSLIRRRDTHEDLLAPYNIN